MKAPVDFMDGQPLRYRLAENEHFIIYSVGLRFADNGGRLPLRGRSGWYGDGPNQLSSQTIVWPLPASSAAVEKIRLDDSRMYQRRSRRGYP